MRLFTDIIMTWSALAILSFLVVGGGAGLAKLCRFPGFEQSGLGRRCAIALLCGLGGMPILLDFAGRMGPQIMTAAAVLLALAGVPALVFGLAKPLLADRRTIGIGTAIGAAWIVVATLSLVDLPWGPSGFSQAYYVLDYVKHTTMIWSIGESGTPPWNPTYYEPGRQAAYYYFFYTTPSAVYGLISAFGVGARHIAYASAILMGFALYALVEIVSENARADEAVGAKPSRFKHLWTLLLLATTGLDMLFVVPDYTFKKVLTDPEWWSNDQISSWFATTLWVPHHLAALCAAFVAFIALARPDKNPRDLLLAALAFASMAGMSVYVAIGGVGTAALWAANLTMRRRWPDLLRLAGAGAGSVLLAAPWLATLKGQLSGPTLGFGLRYYQKLPPELIDTIKGKGLNLLVIPTFYLVEFGVFALGAFVFWRMAGKKGLQTELGRILAAGALASLLIGSFLRSIIIANDLGWRVMMFAQLAALVWTLAAARAGLFSSSNQYSRIARIFLITGYLMVGLTIVQMRITPPDTEIQRNARAGEAEAWNWLNHALPHGAIVQQRPENERAFGYGLYGRFPTYISDFHNGGIFGAPDPEIIARLAEITPIFDNPNLDWRAVCAIARAHKISALIFSALDKTFDRAWPTQPAFENADARIYLVAQACQ